MTRPVLSGIAALLLLYAQTVVGNPQRTAIGDRDGLLTDNEPDRDALGAGRSGRSGICCRCISLEASCNTDLDVTINEKTPHVGLTCLNEVWSDVFGCDIDGVTVSEMTNLKTDREEGRCMQENGHKTCCDPVTSTFNNHINFVTNQRSRNRKNRPAFLEDTESICQSDDVGATSNFEFGVVCGKRDSRVYFDAGLSPGFTNPGEWPWAVLIYAGRGSQRKYVGSGALVDNDVVATVAHNMGDYVNNPEQLVVHVGDWDPNTAGSSEKEKHSHVEMTVICVKVHERFTTRTLENNIAVLKLRPIEKKQDLKINSEVESVLQVVDLRSAPFRRGDDPSGPPKHILTIGEREGLLSNSENVDGLGAAREGLEKLAPSYINTICLPLSEDQFTTETCWVAAWGSHLERQREVDIPLVDRSQCERVLKPIFRERGNSVWQLNPTDLCAGGVPGKDTCEGEGGAPLVCYSKERDQYFAVGLVAYGISCNTTLPGIYTNLMNGEVKQWIRQAFGNPNYC